MRNEYHPTPLDIVEKMLDLAEVTPADVVYDLGCGDGRIVAAAARRGARAVGIDRDPYWIEYCKGMVFTNDHVVSAIDSWLQFGEQSMGTAHQGYFAGGGWAARCLKMHRDEIAVARYGRTEFRLADYFEADFSEATVICCYLHYEDMDKLRPRFGPHQRIVTNKSKFTGLQPVKIDGPACLWQL